MKPANSRHTQFSIQQAMAEAPALAGLRQRMEASQQNLRWVEHLIPPHLRPLIKAGPLQDSQWCLLVSSAAASTKLRQLVPALKQALASNGHELSAIRIKIQIPGR